MEAGENKIEFLENRIELLQISIEALKKSVAELKLLSQDGPKIYFPIKDTLVSIPVREIIWCEVVNHSVIFMLTGKRDIVLTRSLSDVEKKLSAYGFIRIHESFLINRCHIKELLRRNNGYVQMSDEKKLDVSGKRMKNLLKKLPII